MKNNKFVFVTGGVRSGKSRFSESLANVWGQDDVTYVATLEAGDEEMERRIAKHRDRRPKAWRTVVAPTLTAGQINTIDSRVILFDCLSGYVSNQLLRLEALGEDACLDQTCLEIQKLVSALSASPSRVIVVSNEVGMGVVPEYPLGRWFRDALGLANQEMAAAADTAILVVAGLPLLLKGDSIPR